eukprot:TRINITY_DN16880_c0_g1_i2.p1 TRINITY_DN16880_c0_g1~~TRINITY_DN16880_c0_g1_i2.p1  ORF type:complete len:131 (+),score=0.78 TRINITY_DN16880_c0_g1_i2:117-509(+)
MCEMTSFFGFSSLVLQGSEVVGDALDGLVAVSGVHSDGVGILVEHDVLARRVAINANHGGLLGHIHAATRTTLLEDEVLSVATETEELLGSDGHATDLQLRGLLQDGQNLSNLIGLRDVRAAVCPPCTLR